MKKTLLLLSTLLTLSTQSHAIELKVPVGATGYLGEVVPPVAVVTSYLPTKTDLEANRNHYGINTRESHTILSIDYFNEIDATGIPFINIDDPKGAMIVLTINGVLNAQFTRYDGSIQHVSATYNRSKATSLNGLYIFNNAYAKGDTNLGINPKSGQKNFFKKDSSSRENPAIFTVSSYSAYAVGGKLKPGTYKLRPTISGVTLWAGSYNTSHEGTPNLFTQADNVTITALKACRVTPITQTDITFPTQLSQNFPTPKKLASNLASIQVNCNEAGKEGFLTLSPGNALVENSTTGMVLTSSTANAVTDLPYIATSLSSQSDTVCNANSSDAISYLNSHSLSTLPSQNFIKSLYFNLCALGNVKPGSYKGHVNVSILIE
ncbi:MULTISPECIES: hypothetical protein [Providencia]|uniref:hypothetical protein n=1 Tax=Providencia TaxID=586 RepID=UPI0009083DCA|nr:MULTISPECIES: hypothetical protein [Providencia]APC11131.1 hypothetical protein RB151_014510 [Providencia rettgeri]AVL74739.1 hypothetical protein CEQ08_13885 [Providencia rettgeri]